MGSLADLVYLPRPRDIRPAAGHFKALAGARIALLGNAQALHPAGIRVQKIARDVLGMEWRIGAGERAGDVPAVSISVAPGQSAERYQVKISPAGIELRASDARGMSYAVTTLGQIIRQSSGALPAGEIVDWPDFPVRGLMLDISRDKVPTMETLFSLVDLLSDLKINHLELYTEHTFAYSAHREVWAEASPMTGEEILALDAYCRERFIDLVPNQNSFGHMHRWLSHARYRHLAECPDGFESPWGEGSNEPYGLDPTNPACIELLDGLYAELLPHFGSRLFNAGCDETFDLGMGKSRELCERVGKGRVYLDFLRKIHRLTTAHGHTLLYWGDIIMQYPALVPELPRDAIALEWGYEADHPFEEHGARYREAGVPWWVCPGTSSWNSIAGRTDNCLANIRAAARAGLTHGASGFLNTDWGDNGHWQVLPVSYLGFAAGAALSWCREANGASDLRRELDVHVFRDRAGIMGTLVRDLGNTYQREGPLKHNGSALFYVLLNRKDVMDPRELSAEALGKAREWVDASASRLHEARMERPDAALILDELANTVRLFHSACDHARALLEGTWNDRRAMARAHDELRFAIGEYRRLWVRRNRIGGLADSVRRLERLLPSPNPRSTVAP
jgi:hexosaminidase